MQSLLFSIDIVLPVFLIIILGKILYQFKIIDDIFIKKSSDLVFYLGMPLLIFQEISALKLDDLKLNKELTFTFLYLTLTFILALTFALFFIKDKRKIGVFAQAVFRGNYGIVALALLNNMYGSKGLAQGAIVLSVATICYNSYSTIGFIIPQQQFNFKTIKKILFKVITNPIIIGILSAFVYLIIKHFSNFELPSSIKTTIKNCASITLPISLLGIGASIKFSTIRNDKFLIVLITVLRTVISPLIFTIIAILVGFRGIPLASLFFLAGVPTAVASFALAHSMEGDGELAANVVATTTAASVLTLTMGIFLLKYFNFI